MKCNCINKISCFIGLIFIVLVGLNIQYPYMNEFPSFIHAWSQSDRYAIALGFLDNNFDLFHPETFIYNKQFPNEWTCAYDNTITSVDFPLMEFVVAIVMKITGVTSPWIFRTCTLIIALLGMFFLYKLTFLLTNNWVKSLFVTAVAMTSPVYAYYFNGFIPGIPALTFAIISLYFYVKYYETNNNKQFVISLLFVALSVLVRSSFAVVYVALLCFEFLRILRKESVLRNKIIPVAFSALLVLAYYLWNRHLSAQNGTLFLSDLMPANDWDDFWQRMAKTRTNWNYHYFGKIHYCSFVVIAVMALSFVCFKRIKNSGKDDESCKKSLPLFVLLSIMFFGYALFTVAMAKQFPDHDYYLIDTYFLPLLFLFALILRLLPETTKRYINIISLFVSLLLIFFMLKNVKEMQQKRRARYWGVTAERTIDNFKDSERFLDSMNVSPNAKILTLYAYPQNTPFILMNRKGYTMMYDKNNLMKIALSFDYDYVIIENEIYDKYREERKELFSDLEYLSDNGKISLFVKKK